MTSIWKINNDGYSHAIYRELSFVKRSVEPNGFISYELLSISISSSFATITLIKEISSVSFLSAFHGFYANTSITQVKREVAILDESFILNPQLIRECTR